MVKGQDTPQVQVAVTEWEMPFIFGRHGGWRVGVDRNNFMSLQCWKMIAKPPIQQTTAEYRSASGHMIPILGTVHMDSFFQAGEEKLAPKQPDFTVTKLNLNLIGLDSLGERHQRGQSSSQTRKECTCVHNLRSQLPPGSLSIALMGIS